MSLDDLPIKVYCVQQEYWFIRRQRCTCGCTLVRVEQSLTTDAPWATDTIVTRCHRCQTPKIFVFDISPWYPRDAVALANKRRALKKVLTRSEMRAALAPPMECTLTFIARLVDAKDQLAIGFLGDVIADARSRVIAARTFGPGADEVR